jgi:hypothetical protein
VKSISHDEWRVHVQNYRQDQNSWNRRELGAKPGHNGCCCPAQILEEFGFTHEFHHVHDNNGDDQHRSGDANDIAREQGVDELRRILDRGTPPTIPGAIGAESAASSGSTAPIKTKANGANARPQHWREGMITAHDLCTVDFPPLKFMVPKLIPEGLTILAGRPKIGKSWLVLSLGIVLANGVAALGLDYGLTTPPKGSVLYLGLEDGWRRLKRRMTKLIGARPENWPKELHLKTNWRRLDQGGLDDIRDWFQTVKARGGNPILVVVDTLAKVRPPSTSKTSPYQNDHDALAGLQKLAEELRIAVIVNHHDRKMEADDVFDTVSGTLGLTGAVDTILVLTKKAQGTILHIRGRDIEDETSLAMRFEKDTCRWSVEGTVADRQEEHRSDERKRVIAALSIATAAEGLTVPEIVIGAQLRNRNAADLLLSKMAQNGEIRRIKRGVYGLPQAVGQIGQKEGFCNQPTEPKEENIDLSNLSDLSRISAPDGNTLPLNVQAEDNQASGAPKMAPTGLEGPD